MQKSPQETSSTSDNPPPLEDIQARAGTPWPDTGSASENLFKSRKDWPILPAPTSIPISTIKTEAQPQEAAKQLEENVDGDQIALFVKM